ncbi:hypothetical protein AAFN88_08470 [Pelagibius sp. CAU 1746]|uniref:hypothetical protein n=1 Tax=Pelagibius sp. CAU 1746 TaxID=3140370 RepID=UPI00325BE30D
MSRPLNIIDLAITEEVSNDAAEVARRLDQAADLVEEFAEESALGALNALLSAATADKNSAGEICRLAEETSDQTEILHSEIERFLAVSAGQRPN